MVGVGTTGVASDSFGSLSLYRERAVVLREWTDRNGHLNNSYYLVCVQNSFVRSMKLWRGEAHLERSSTGNFTMQSLVTHFRELREGVNLLLTARLLGVDEKRTHVFIEVYNEDSGCLGAVVEKTSINVVRGDPPRVTNFANDVSAELHRVAALHRQAKMPAGVRPNLPLNPRKPVS